MSWVQLKTNFTDAIWDGLQKYKLIQNPDSTVSLVDVTKYTNEDSSFFGAKEANAIDEAVNVIMASLENGTNLYENFNSYFETQKQLFNNKQSQQLSKHETEYKTRIQNFENNQNQEFNRWFASIKNQLQGDIAARLTEQLNSQQTVIQNLTTRLEALENKITVSTAQPSGGKHGDIWFTYKE